jgi:uncharacterized membrane protein YphA (DoxX/SURF4 family)
MKVAILTARILLGLMFLIFGLNNILYFFKMPMPSGDAGIFLGLLVGHKYMTFVSLLQIIAGVLLLVGRFVPLALTLLAPILVNILLFHILISHGGVAPGLIATLLEVFLLFAYRLYFRPLLDPAPGIS